MTKDEWNKLSDKAQWDIKVALRGPDVGNSDVIKWFTTSVIRAQMAGVFRVGGLINTTLNGLIIPSDQALNPHLDWQTKEKLSKDYQLNFHFSGSHFFSHVLEAGQYLELPIWSLPGSVYRAGLLKGGAMRALEFWLETTKDEPEERFELYQSHLNSLKGGVSTW